MGNRMRAFTSPRVYTRACERGRACLTVRPWACVGVGVHPHPPVCRRVWVCAIHKILLKQCPSFALYAPQVVDFARIIVPKKISAKNLRFFDENTCFFVRNMLQ